MAEKVSRLLSASLDYETVRLMINNEIINRLSTKARGIKKGKAVMQGDIARAFSNRCKRPLSAKTLQQLGLEIDDDGFCCPVGSGNTLVYNYELDDNASQTDNSSYSQDPGSSRESSYDNQLESESSAPGRGLSESIIVFRSQKRKRKDNSMCGCMLTDDSLSHILSGFQDGGTTRDVCECREALRTFGQKIYRNQDQIDTDAICSDHSRKFCNLFRMFTNISHKERAYRLDKLYCGLDSWKETRARYSTWFRPLKPVGTHITTSISRFQEKHIRPVVENWSNLKYLTLQGLHRRCFGQSPPPDLRDISMQVNGSVVVPELFKWLKQDFDGKHPDISLRRFVDSCYGRNILQSVVSLDNDDQDNCDELLLGMNHHLGSW